MIIKQNKSKIMAIKTLSDATKNAIIASLVVLFVALVAVVATFVPLYVVANNKINSDRLSNDMRSMKLEQEVMTLFLANDAMDYVEEIIVNGTFRYELQTNADANLGSDGTYEFRKRTYFDAIEVISWYINIPNTTQVPMIDPMDKYFQLKMHLFSPILDASLFSNFLAVGTPPLIFTYVPLNSTGLTTLGFPCAATSPPTCTLTASNGPQGSLVNTMSFLFDPFEDVYVSILDGTSYVGMFFGGSLKVDLMIQLKPIP